MRYAQYCYNFYGGRDLINPTVYTFLKKKLFQQITILSIITAPLHPNLLSFFPRFFEGFYLVSTYIFFTIIKIQEKALGIVLA